MSIQLISNFNYPIGNIIKQELQEAKHAKFAVAFVRYSGIKEIESSLLQCLKNGGNVELIAGLDFRTTDPKSLRYFLDLKKENAKASLYCFGDKHARTPSPTGVVFHPKLYLFEKGREKTGIVGSTNLTKGGLTSNIEVNTIFKEDKPVYFSQLDAVYDSIKNTGSVFAPDEEYVEKYSEVHGAFSKNEDKAKKDKGVQKIIGEIEEKEKTLPSSETLSALIIKVIKRKEAEQGRPFVDLDGIYQGVEEIVRGSARYNFKMASLKDTIRGDIYHNLQGGNEAGTRKNKSLFIRQQGEKGFYTLSDKGRDYTKD